MCGEGGLAMFLLVVLAVLLWVENKKKWAIKLSA